MKILIRRESSLIVVGDYTAAIEPTEGNRWWNQWKDIVVGKRTEAYAGEQNGRLAIVARQ